MIECVGLTKIYGRKVRALDTVNLTIDGGMFGLVGPNGAGKTSLMRILAGLIQPTGGRATVFGHDLTTFKGRAAVKAVLGYLPQELGLYPNLTGREMLDYIAILKGITDPAARRRQVEDLLEVVRLSEVADRRTKTYSGGMKRRVGIAQAMLGQPKLLIVDEPTTGLDPEERVRLRNVLGEIAKRCTVILSTHIIEDISQSCTALALMHKGKVLYHGTPTDLIGAARGHVWLVKTAGELPTAHLAEAAPANAPQGNGGAWNIRAFAGMGADTGLSVAATLHMQDGVQYRVVGTPDPSYNATPAEPSLEDGYLWAMHGARN